MIASDIARAFGLGGVGGELVFVARGAMGEVFRLETERGPVAAKRLFWGPADDEEANAAFQFAAADAGVPIARPLLTTNGDVLKRLPDGWWRVYEWVEGRHVDAHERTPDSVARNVAASLARLHGLKYDTGLPVDPWFGGVADDLVESALAKAESVGVDVDGARRVLPGLAAVSRLTPHSTPIGCHNDPDRGNVIVADDHRVTLVDWDNAGSCYAECELAGAMWQWAVTEEDDACAEIVPLMVRAYRENGGVFEATGLEVFATTMAAWVRYAIDCCNHLVDETTPSDLLAFERPVVDRLADYPVSVARLERLLELVPA